MNGRLEYANRIDGMTVTIHCNHNGISLCLLSHSDFWWFVRFRNDIPRENGKTNPLW